MEQTKKTKKILIIIGIILIVLSLIGYYFYDKYEKNQHIEEVKCTVREQIQLYTYDINVMKNNGYTKYKLLPANTTVNIELDKWHNLEGVGYFYKIKNFDGRDDVYAEEIIHKYIPSGMLEYYNFDNLNYYEVFPTDEYNSIPSKFQACIVDYFYKNQLNKNKQWRFTSISDRAKSVIAYGDFSGNNETDIAILLEDQTAQSNNLLIFHRDTNHTWNVIYTEILNGSPTISSFKKNQLIYMDDDIHKLVNSPNDGIIVKFPYSKKAILYNPIEKGFREYHQYSKEDIKEIEQEDYYNKQQQREMDSTNIEN